MNSLEPRFEDFERIHDFFSSKNDFHFHLDSLTVHFVFLLTHGRIHVVNFKHAHST